MARIEVALPNRLFLKLLLAFWITTSLIVGSVILIPKVLQPQDLQPLKSWQQEFLLKAARRLETLPIRDLDRFADMMRHRIHPAEDKGKRPPGPGMGPLRDDRFRFHLLTLDGRPLGHEAKRLPRAARRFLLENEALTPMAFYSIRSVIFGPEPLTLNGQPTLLLVEMKASHSRSWILYLQENPLMFVLLVALVSGVIFGLVAWHFGRPLNALRLTALQLGHGDLDARVEPRILARRDEVGQLARSFDTMAHSVSTLVREQQRLISDISHELRTPLTRIQLALALAKRKGQASNELTRLEQQAAQMEGMIQELLQLSRLNSQVTDTKQRLNLGDTLERVIDGAAFEAEQAGKRLEVTLPQGLTLNGCETLLQRAVENLLRNAIRYGNQQIRLSAWRRGERLNLRVEDDGPGVPPEQLEAIFKPFHRVSKARDRQSGGWGLGLAIVQGAVTAHQGQIRAEIGVLGGLCVTLTLPIE
ncbi:HAMP domain-containing protein [Ferrimonas sediminicola]|uniref:histidine kinase n=1 Tax=Ferrimonas sediminicola TaxID=2569538 RepID=A0A4U1BBI2_9GAMM|nr:ATP-binding protein [Ferrimonas sediminicola]TKB47954.1 HAMP domain-containing protein [Ferrimonas sediminicola]